MDWACFAVCTIGGISAAWSCSLPRWVLMHISKAAVATSIGYIPIGWMPKHWTRLSGCDVKLVFLGKSWLYRTVRSGIGFTASHVNFVILRVGFDHIRQYGWWRLRLTIFGSFYNEFGPFGHMRHIFALFLLAAAVLDMMGFVVLMAIWWESLLSMWETTQLLEHGSLWR